MLAPVGDDDIIARGKEQRGNEVEDQRRDEQPEKQEQRPVRALRQRYCTHQVMTIVKSTFTIQSVCTQ